MSGKKGAGGRGASRGRAKYQEEHVSEEEDEEFVQKFDVGEKLESKNFPRFFVTEITGEEVRQLFPDFFGMKIIFLTYLEKLCDTEGRYRYLPTQLFEFSSKCH